MVAPIGGLPQPRRFILSMYLGAVTSVKLMVMIWQEVALSEVKVEKQENIAQYYCAA
jgi:hypothetical protein